MTPQSHEAFIKWLEREIAIAEYCAKKSSNFMCDGYQDGFNDGQVEALKTVRKYFSG